MKSITIDTKAFEFGYELILYVSLAYQKFLEGYEVKVITSKLMEPFYFFLKDKNIITRYSKRFYSDGSIHFKQLPKDFIYPDFKKFYALKKNPIDHKKPIFLISNKYNTEWNNKPINFLSLDSLEKIFSILNKKYTIIYNHPNSDKIVIDNNQDLKFEYKSLLAKYNVIDINDIETQNINELQLILGSYCDHKISVQGGNSILASFTGGTNDIYAVKGAELKNNCFNWYYRFSNCKTNIHKSYDSLLNKIAKY